ncbi:Crp/Fnr family transcriptional regulator [Clostridium merdae]|uniref:Crp/Fnr family transcriptional regulator n=1 Tax=Clostridium merdae TaxID=1958780 RepID=UPI000A26AD19|nr:Crp/Fnr family transcriptional regulator [Clostridium merdae]
MTILKATEHLEKKLQVSFCTDVFSLINDHAKIITYSMGDTILWEGDTASHLYYLIKGVVRGYYIDRDGNDITKCFCAEEDFFSTQGYRTGTSATFTIECLENCNCVQLPYTIIEHILQMDKELCSIVSHLFQNEIENQELRCKELMLLNAKERYLAFCKDNPQLQNRIALKYIASYIGVRAASLSRIRKESKS